MPGFLQVRQIAIPVWFMIYLRKRHLKGIKYMSNYVSEFGIDFSIPEYLNKAIDDYLYALKNKKFCDCEATELSLCLRDAVKFDGITEQQKQTLIDKINERGEKEDG